MDETRCGGFHFLRVESVVMKIYTFNDAIKYCYLDVIRKKFFDFKGRSDRQEYWIFMIIMAIPMSIFYGGAVAGSLMELFKSYDMIEKMKQTGADFAPDLLMADQSAFGIPVVTLTFTILLLLWNFFHLIPALSLTFRRLHDIGKSGWYLLLGFIPIFGGIIILIFMCLSSQPGENKYGPSSNDC
ncbi:hypothetical protein C4J81_08330 [Deltaproteobacteria bacterium Smac51]|nr:hypothetical protein C4J81_08330 [Deltaproteobacteria bacterium Smac51]